MKFLPDIRRFLSFTTGMGHEPTAADALRDINRELLVTSMSDIPPSVEAECDKARQHVLNALHKLEPPLPGKPLPPEELPVAEFKAKAAEAESKVFPLVKPALDQITRNDPERN